MPGASWPISADKKMRYLKHMYEIYLTQEKENEAMSRELVFDYSKTAGFIREEEIVNMKKAVLGAKRRW